MRRQSSTLGRSAPTAGVVPLGHRVTWGSLYPLTDAADLAASSIFVQ